jgi:hypothetical protein
MAFTPGRYNEMAVGRAPAPPHFVGGLADAPNLDKDGGSSLKVPLLGRLFKTVEQHEGLDAQQAMAALPIGDEPGVPVMVRKLIRDAALVVGVGNCDEAVRQAQALAGKFGGYVQEATNEQVVLRVPSDTFDTALETIARMGLVVERKVQARDVTEEYCDLELRLRSKRAMLERLQELLKKAEKVEDILKIETEISRLMTEVEQLEGKLRLMQNQVAYSKIAVQFVLSTQAAGAKAMARLPFWWLDTLGLSALGQHTLVE